MRTLIERLAVLLAVTFVVLAVTDSSAVLVTAVATIAVMSLVGLRYAAVSIRARSMTIGSRARAHRESMSSQPAPTHPATPGRTRSRAPSQPLAAA